ncbi:hypothetical protein L873DRAFT_1789717 [Choiromyces venosus 120613-1]|uniref:Uncharacterized protein n=1 Tax=Choiromyces venosus 120613-1 TaxID=1336337 RepID=A0A3N4JRB7_9PEZI|nr:hypothetical protein L873DRAFT_1789717 [Choiromyces venosus 120613-1]
MKNLPTFSALNALIRASKPCHDIWLENEYGICEAIAKNEFGEFWNEATELLTLQAELKRASEAHEGSTRFFGKIEEAKLRRVIKPVISKVAMGLVRRGQGEVTVRKPPTGSSDRMGILNGGVKIGKEEATQLLCYKHKVAKTRNVFIKTVLRAHSYGTAPRRLRFKTARPPADVIHRIDRAIYNYWLVLLACTPDFITCLATFEYHNLSDSLSAFLDSQDALSDQEWQASIDREYENVKAYLDFEGRKEELEELCEVTYFTHCLVELPGVGGGHYFGEWGKEEDEGLQGWAANQIRRAARDGGVDAGGYRAAG